MFLLHHQTGNFLKEILGDDRLEQVVDRSGAESLHCRLQGGMSGDHNDRRFRTALRNAAYDIDAARARHHEVADHDVGRFGVDVADCFIAVRRGIAGESFLTQQCRGVLAESILVIDEQYACGHLALSMGRSTVKQQPLPGSLQTSIIPPCPCTRL